MRVFEVDEQRGCRFDLLERERVPPETVVANWRCSSDLPTPSGATMTISVVLGQVARYDHRRALGRLGDELGHVDVARGARHHGRVDVAQARPVESRMSPGSCARSRAAVASSVPSAASRRRSASGHHLGVPRR